MLSLKANLPPELSIFALRCLEHQRRYYSSETTPASPRISPSNNPESPADYVPDEYERTTYYNGISESPPTLLYRSDYPVPFPKPSGRFSAIPVKSVWGVHDTSLNRIWLDVAPRIYNLLKERNLRSFSIDPARFFTHEEGNRKNGTLGPPVVWIGCKPESTTAATAHTISLEILALLRANDAPDVVVEWRESAFQQLAGPAPPMLLSTTDSNEPTHHVRRFLTSLHGVPVASAHSTSGTLTLWFRENRDRLGQPTKNVFGVTNCHVIQDSLPIAGTYDQHACNSRIPVHFCSQSRFQRGLNEITTAIANRASNAQQTTLSLSALNRAHEDMTEQDEDVTKEDKEKVVGRNRRALEDALEAARDLECFYNKIVGWSDFKFRILGDLEYAAPITIDAATQHTIDWAAFKVRSAAAKRNFAGNIIDLGSHYTPEALTDLIFPNASGPFTFPHDRKLRIQGCASQEFLAKPPLFDAANRRCLMVAKDGSATDLTIGRYAGLPSWLDNPAGPSIELAIFNSGLERNEDFSAKGDSGALVWYVDADGSASIFGQLRGANYGHTSKSVFMAYCTPGWFLLEKIRERFPYASFYETSWPV
ncbi:hypothetical protein HMN09_00039400 [Mycena chlorophos]|uniref:Uncharacterized protein n=1 Tax=Mycena chlorophos TaxID=658473 RepID=A0A8H6TT52_MYCCL|nr:hypothetical protein HMN09_00039400 [Mycena chlorophos]